VQNEKDKSHKKNILIDNEWNRILESHWKSSEDPQGKRAGCYKSMAMKM